MKIRLSINIVLFLVLAYPLVLFIPSLLGYHAFFLTSPYFFLVFNFLALSVLVKGRVVNFNLLPITIGILIISIINYTTIRYSLPVFFVLYIVLLFFFLRGVSCKLNKQIVLFFFIGYVILSIPFVFLDNGKEITGRFVGFIGSPTVYAGIITTLYVIVTKKWLIKSYKFIATTLTVLGLVYLSKTRLILIFILIYPFIKYLLESKSWINTKKIFIIFFISIMSIYPMYEQVVKLFPSLVTLRYENNKDASFGLRYFVYKRMIKEYGDGTFFEKTFGKGNEHSRMYVKNLFKFDLMPHNDFIRLLIDWGIIGFLFFLFFLYKISIKNEETCYISIIYMLLFYSNMIFNLFLISVLIIFYFDNKEKLKIK